MKRTALALLAFALIPPAAAQVNPQNMPANTVYGRLGVGSGPGQAIPLSVLFGAFVPPTPPVAVSSVTNSDGTLVISPTAGAVVASAAPMAASTVKCNSTGAPAIPRDCPVGAGLGYSGGSLVATGTISYTSPGTGAVTQTLANRLGTELWASDFGAVCNGSTDDHLAFQNMINAAQSLGLSANFTGNCALTTGLTIATNAITFNGRGRAHSFLLPSFGISAISISAVAGYLNLGHLSISYPGACNHSGSVPAINVSGTDFTTIDDILILCSDYGITYTSSGGAVLSNSFIALGSATTGIGILEQGAGNNDSSISNVLVTTNAAAPAHAVAMIYCVICSGLKVINFKGNGSWNTGITIASTGVIDGDFFISNSSLEGINGVGSVGWLIERTDSTSFFGDLVATSTEFSGQYCLFVPADANGPWIDVLSFNGNTCFTNSAGPAALSVDSVVGLMMSNNNLFCAPGTATSVIGSQVIGGVVGPNIGGGPSNNGTKWTTNPACGAGSNAGTRVTTIAPF